MKLTDEDRRVIRDLMLDYQWYVTKFPAFYMDAITYRYVGTKTMSPWAALQGKFAGFAPLVIAALTGEVPAGFTLLRTLDERWMAWGSDPARGITGPTSEFQARLWCARCAYLQHCCDAADGMEGSEQRLDETIQTCSEMRAEGVFVNNGMTYSYP